MSLQFSWNVTHIKVITSLNTLEDVVVEVNIYPYATDGTNSIFGDELVVELDSPNTADFVSYNNLTVLKSCFVDPDMYQNPTVSDPVTRHC